MPDFVETGDNMPTGPQGSEVQQQQATQGVIAQLNRRYGLDLVTPEDVEVPFNLDGQPTVPGAPIGSTVPMTGQQRSAPGGTSRASVARQFPAARSRLVK